MPNECFKAALEGVFIGCLVALTPWGCLQMERVTGVVWERRELELLQKEADDDAEKQ